MSRSVVSRACISLLAVLILGVPALASAADREDPPPIAALGVQPGQNGHIVFDYERQCGSCGGEAGMAPGIYSFDPFTGKRRLLVKGKNAGSPRFTANGNQILYTNQRFGQQDLFLMNANGTKSRAITNDQAVELEPFFVPSGKIGFHTVDGLPFRYLRMDRNGGKPQRAGIYDPLRSTGSTARRAGKVVYTACLSRKGSCHVFIRRVDGEVDQLTEGAVRDSDASLSPTGGRILYVRSAPDGKPGERDEVWSMNADGTAAGRLLESADGERFTGAIYSPNGRKVLVERSTPNPSGDGATGSIELINLNGGKQRIQGPQGLGVLFDANWQPFSG